MKKIMIVLKIKNIKIFLNIDNFQINKLQKMIYVNLNHYNKKIAKEILFKYKFQEISMHICLRMINRLKQAKALKSK